MSPYYLFWAMLIVVSLWVSIGGFLWAHRNGQFNDQERARYLPLRGEPAVPPGKGADGARREALVMLMILAVGLSGLIAVFIISLVRALEGRL